MTNKQTIDGVSRELLGNIESTWRQAPAFSNKANDIIAAGLGELRALLAAERCTSCDGSGDIIDLTGEWRGYCACPTGVALKSKPSAQHQGEVERLRKNLIETEDRLELQRQYNTQRHVELSMESMQVMGENTRLRAQLVERDAALALALPIVKHEAEKISSAEKQFPKGFCGIESAKALAAIEATLSTSAEPKPRGEAVAWTRTSPTVAGAYWIRGNGLARDALIQVVDDPEGLLCNLHQRTTNEDFGYGYAVSELNDTFEWLGPLYSAPPHSGDANEMVLIRQRIAVVRETRLAMHKIETRRMA